MRESPDLRRPTTRVLRALTEHSECSPSARSPGLRRTPMRVLGEYSEYSQSARSTYHRVHKREPPDWTTVARKRNSREREREREREGKGAAHRSSTNHCSHHATPSTTQAHAKGTLTKPIRGRACAKRARFPFDVAAGMHAMAPRNSGRTPAYRIVLRACACGYSEYSRGTRSAHEGYSRVLARVHTGRTPACCAIARTRACAGCSG